MKWSQNDNEYFAQFYAGALRKLDEYLPRREIDTDRLLELISDAKKQISEIEEIVEEMEIFFDIKYSRIRTRIDSERTFRQKWEKYRLIPK